MRTRRTRPATALNLGLFCVALATAGLVIYAHAERRVESDVHALSKGDEHGEEAHDGHEAQGKHAEEAACCEHGHEKGAEHAQCDAGLAAHDDHDGHDHNAQDHDGHGHEEENGDGAHDGHDHGAHGEDAESVAFDAHDREAFGILTDTAKPGQLHTELSLPGRIEINGDRVSHVVPVASGIVREVVKKLGDEVHSGEVMAWIESSELGAAKVDYLGKWAEVGCCTIDLTRAQEIHDNTTTYLGLLQSSPPLETLRKTNGTAMGENRSTLVSTYADLVFARAAHTREKSLYEGQISSQDDFLAAESAYKKADAHYAAAQDSIAFAISRDLMEAKRAQQVREIELKGAGRVLHVMGLTEEDIEELQLLAQDQAPPAKETSIDDEDKTSCACGNPDCTTCGKAKPPAKDHNDADERLAWYPLRAPFDGTVIQKHLSIGEKVTDDTDAFTVADLSSVWIDLDIYQKDLSSVKLGQELLISGVPGIPAATGTITYIAPFVDEETRTALARVVLPNPDGNWRPGLFVDAKVLTGEETAGVMVPKVAVQNLAGENVVFLDTDAGFESAPVVLGKSDSERVEVLSGLRPGQRYVAQGAFELKAKIVTSGLDPHAGHGH